MHYFNTDIIEEFIFSGRPSYCPSEQVMIDSIFQLASLKQRKIAPKKPGTSIITFNTPEAPIEEKFLNQIPCLHQRTGRATI
jgi:hypothetical protein